MRLPFSAKHVLIGIGAVIGVVLLATVAFVVFFPKDLAIREMERRIEAATARDLTIGGKVDLSFFPALGFSAEQASLSNPEGFGDAPFLAADRIVFAVALMPLLRGDVEVKRLTLEGAEINLIAKTDGSANWTFPTDESESQSTLEDLRLDNVGLSGSRITFQGSEAAPPLALENVDATLALASLDEPAQVEAQFDYLSERLDLDAEFAAPRALLEQGKTPFTAHVVADPLDVTLGGEFDSATGAIGGTVEAVSSSLRALLAWMGSPLPEGGDGFGAFRMNATVAHLAERTSLTDAVFTLDGQEARGALDIVTRPEGRMLVTGALAAPRFDLNLYLPPPAQGAGEAGVSTSSAWSTDPLDLAGLKALDAELAFEIAALKFQQMDFENVRMALRIANGAADARLSQFAFYGGTGTARMIADGAGATPRIAVELDAQNIQALPLLTAAIGFDKIEGRGRLSASFAGEGASQAAIMRTLTGNAAFNFNDGAWRGVNLAQVARVVQALATGQQAGQGGETDFAEMSATFSVANGVAATENLRLLNPFVRLEGAGVIDIGAQTLDMRLEPRAVRSAQGQGGDVAAQGLGVPFRASGPWSRVDFRPALGDVVQNQLREQTRRILQEQEPGSPLATLGEALFGRQAQAPITPSDTAEEAAPAPDAPAQTPAPQPQQQPDAASILGDLFRRAQQPKQEEPAAEPAPATP